MASLNQRLQKLEERDKKVTTTFKLSKPPAITDFVEECSIVQKEGEEESGLIPFKLWPQQRRALEEMDYYSNIPPDSEEHRHILSVKGRQIGLTWLDEAFWLYKGTFWANRLFLFARQSEQYAMDAIRRLHVLRSSLPNEWKVPLVTDNLTILQLANGARYEALTATKRIGRGYAAYGGMADEFAFWDWQAEQLAAMKSGCAHLHIITTGNGADYTEELYDKAIKEQGDFHFIFIPASADPRRTPDWRRKNVLDSASPRLAKREYAETPEDAFSSPEGAFFERWDRAAYVQSFSHDPAFDTYLSVDYGWAHGAVIFAQQLPSGQLFIFDEYVHKKEKVSEWARAVRQRMDTVYEDTPAGVFGDPAGKSRSSQTAESDVEVFEQNSEYTFVSIPSGVRDGTVLLTELVGHEETPIIVHPRCVETIDALTRVKPDRNKPDLYDERSNYTHVLDCLRYLVVNLQNAPGHWDDVPSDLPFTRGINGRTF